MARGPNKVIVTCALTGSIHTPTMSDYLPLTPYRVSQSRPGASLLFRPAFD